MKFQQPYSIPRDVPVELTGQGSRPATDHRMASDRPLSVALAVAAWPPNTAPNGVVTQAASLAEGLRAAGHRACIIAHHAPEGYRDDHLIGAGQGILPRPWFDRILWKAAPGAALDRAACRSMIDKTLRAVDERGIDLIEMEEAFGWPLRVAPRIPVPVVVRLHGPWFVNGPLRDVPIDAAFRRRVRLEGEAIRSSPWVTALSRDMLERVRRYYGLPLESAEVIPGVAPAVDPNRRWRASQADQSLILFVGRFDSHKGGDVMIRAFASLARRRPEARLLFVGPDHGIPSGGGLAGLQAYLAEHAADALAAGRIEWAGQQPNSALAALRLRAGITVVASRYENCPTTVLEAMAHGCPLVATRAGGIPEIVEDGKTGLICRADDAEDMARSLGELLDSPGLAARLGSAAGDDVARRFHPDAIARRMASYYRRVVERSAGLRRPAPTGGTGHHPE